MNVILERMLFAVFCCSFYRWQYYFYSQRLTGKNAGFRCNSIQRYQFSPTQNDTYLDQLLKC